MMFHAPMVDLAKTPDDVKKEETNNGLGVAAGMKPKVAVYPYGCCLSLDDETLKKLGLDGDMPQIGEMVHFCCMAKVTSASQNEQEDDTGVKSTCHRVELQIIQMGVPGADGREVAAHMRDEATSARRKRFYPSQNAEPDGDEA